MSDVIQMGLGPKTVVNAASGATTLSLPAHTIQAGNNEDLVISALNDLTNSESNLILGVINGGTIHGSFTAITVTSGVAICYQHSA